MNYFVIATEAKVVHWAVTLISLFRLQSIVWKPDYLVQFMIFIKFIAVTHGRPMLMKFDQPKTSGYLRLMNKWISTDNGQDRNLIETDVSISLRSSKVESENDNTQSATDQQFVQKSV